MKKSAVWFIAVLPVCFFAAGWWGLIRGQAVKAQGATTEPCLAWSSWVSAPNPPVDVPQSAVNCQFHQFVWQWFLQLASPVEPGKSQRNFENPAKYPILGINPCPGAPPQLSAETNSLGLGIRVHKQTGPAPFHFFLPKDIDQAGSGQPLFDQNGKVVYYNVRYTPNECTVNPHNLDASFPDKPPDTVTELKTSWRQIEPAEADRYYTTTGTIVDDSGQPTTVLLGMVGFHLVKNTPNHPEFIWATFEHVDNAPNCDITQPPPAQGWSFTSEQCAKCLANPYQGDCPNVLTGVCKFNLYTGKINEPDEVCRASANGGGSLTNQTNIESLNRQLVGPGGILSSLPSSNPMAVFKNYILVGTLWIKNPFTNPGPWVQDGSANLLNTTMETYDQNDSGGGSLSVKNCFTCHGFNGPENTASISHILPIQKSLLLVSDDGK